MNVSYPKGLHGVLCTVSIIPHAALVEAGVWTIRFLNDYK